MSKQDYHRCRNMPRALIVEYDLTSFYANEKYRWSLMYNNVRDSGYKICRISHCPFCGINLPTNEKFHESVVEHYANE